MIVAQDYCGSPHKVLDYWKEENKQFFKIREIRIWKHEVDAILSGFYETQKIDKFLSHNRIVNVPHFVLIDEFENEFRTNGCNCGYGGSGPNASIRILKDIGLINIEDVVKNNSIIHIEITNNTPEIKAEKSQFETFERDQFAREHGYSNFSSATIIKHNNHLVFAEDEEYSKDSIGFLHYYLERVIDKVDSVIIFTNKEDCLLHGKFISSELKKDERCYQIVVRGKNGVEIWLNTFISQQLPLGENDTIHKVLQMIEFPPLNREQSILDKIKKVLNGHKNEQSIHLRVESGNLVSEPVML